MSTRAELTDAELSEALRHIDAISRDVPISKTLTELQLVVERLTFSGLHEREAQNDPATFAEIDLFFRDEVSNGMVALIRWMAERSVLGALAGEQGRVFLDHCMSAYRKVQEVQFVTAIELTDQHKHSIARRLRAIYPEPARILFTTSPGIVAGFVINVGQSVIDKSLRTHVATTIPRATRLQDLNDPGDGIG